MTSFARSKILFFVSPTSSPI